MYRGLRCGYVCVCKNLKYHPKVIYPYPSHRRMAVIHNGGDFAFQGTFGNIWRHFWSRQLGEVAAGIPCIGTRDAANHLLGIGQSPTTKNYLATKCQ